MLESESQVQDFKSSFLENLRAAMQVDFEDFNRQPPTELVNKYQDPAWLFASNPGFEFEKVAIQGENNIFFHFKIEKGKVTTARINGRRVSQFEGTWFTRKALVEQLQEYPRHTQEKEIDPSIIDLLFS